MNNQIDELEQKIEKLKAQQKKKEEGEKKDNLSVMRISLEFVSPIMVSAFLGIYIDRFFNSSPFGLVILLFLGIAASMLTIYRLSKREDS